MHNSAAEINNYANVCRVVYQRTILRKQIAPVMDQCEANIRVLGLVYVGPCFAPAGITSLVIKKQHTEGTVAGAGGIASARF